MSENEKSVNACSLIFFSFFFRYQVFTFFFFPLFFPLLRFIQLLVVKVFFIVDSYFKNRNSILRLLMEISLKFDKNYRLKVQHARTRTIHCTRWNEQNCANGWFQFKKPERVDAFLMRYETRANMAQWIEWLWNQRIEYWAAQSGTIAHLLAPWLTPLTHLFALYWLLRLYTTLRALLRSTALIRSLTWQVFVHDKNASISYRVIKLPKQRGWQCADNFRLKELEREALFCRVTKRVRIWIL